jgi:uncharacterized repeat protein (TIGR01451 family)
MASRGLWHFMGARTKRSLALSWSALFVLSLLLQYFSFALAPAALAVHDEGLFELDGNTVNDPATAGDDWDSHPNATGNRYTFVTDELSNKTDDIFTGGSTKDDLNTSGWNWTTGSVPDKDNIENAFAASYDHNGHTFVYFGLDRFANNGDAFTGFWFFKGGVGPVAGGSFSGPHQVGDLLVLSNFTNGGATSTIELYEWVGSGGNVNGTLQLLATGTQECTQSPQDDRACAVTNTAPITPSWTFDDKFTGGTSNPIPVESFFEGGIDLDSLYPGGKAPCFGSFLAETRASQSVDAVLKDFAGGSFNTCVPPTIATDASVSTFHFGDANVTDTATLSGTDGPASGTVKFFVCTPGQITGTGCPSGGSQVGGTVAVTTSANGGTATSAGYSPAAAGKYCFRAEYTPNAASQYLAASHTNATTECFTVVKNDTSITTAADQTITVGADISDSATLSGATSDATGTIVFKAYGPGDDCTATLAFTSDPFTVSGNGTYGPVSFAPATAGTYHWIATYSGDAKNAGSSGQCGDTGENDTVNKAHPTVVTVASAAVVVGNPIHDTATLAGGHAPTGSITFDLYGPDNATCTGDAVFSATVAVNGNGNYESGNFTPTAAGTYRWIANYSGDANNTATANGCNEANESVIVNKTTPSIATSLVSGDATGANISIALGASAHDTSTLTGATGNAGGTVHYQVFSNVACTTLFADAGTKDVVNGVPGDSDPVQFNSSGIYYWQADYSGDANNGAAPGDCTEETVSVGLSNPTITTNASASVLVGGQIHDTATLADGFSPTGSITFDLYGPDDATCATTPVFSSTVTVDGNGDYVSSAYTATSAGVYRWIATYSGDGNNAVAAGICNDANENVIVTTPNLDAVKLVATGDGPFAPTSVATPGAVVKFQITVTNSGNGAATDVPVSDNIAPLLTHAVYNNDCNLGCNLVGSTLNWTIPSIDPNGGSATLTFSVTLDDTFPTGTTHLPNVVVVTGPGSNCAAGSQDDNCDTDTTVATAVLTIDKSVDLPNGPGLTFPEVEVGDSIPYVLHYSGAGELTGAFIVDVLPVGIDYEADSASSNDDFAFTSATFDDATNQWTLRWDATGTLSDPANGEVTFTGVALAAAADLAQPLTNTATIDSAETEPVSDTADVSVVAPPLDIVVTPPPTDTFTPQTSSSNPGFALMLILLGVAGLTLGIGFITPTPARVRRRNRLG